MAKKSDVVLKVKGISGATPVGVTLTYTVGQVPVALVDLAPGAPGSSDTPGAGVLTSVDKLKRKNDITIDISVQSHKGGGGDKTKTLQFVGLLDGLSIGNMVGNNSYQAVIKNKAQTLLELTTYTPGLHPAGINIYRYPSYTTKVDSQGQETDAVKAWTILTKGKNLFSVNPIKGYTNLMKLIIQTQKLDWPNFVGISKLMTGEVPFAKIFSSKNYQQALTKAEKIFEKIDTSAVDGLTIPSAITQSQEKVKQLFTQGPNNLLENYLNFLSFMGCTLIFGNSSIFAVPINSVIKQPSGTKPGYGGLQTTPNSAGPADYNGYHYNDVGYRDIANVIVASAGFKGGSNIGGLGNDRGAVAHFSEEEGLSEASGVLVVARHPWMMLNPTAPFATDAKQGKQKMDSSPQSMYSEMSNFEDATNELAKQRAAREKEKKQALEETLKDILTNYAETKFYQARFADRTGTISMDFNPLWVPGTGGSLYIRETDMFIHFYVNSVTHRIDLAPPNSGAATTTVQFCCGRLGKKPVGTEQDMFLMYDIDKEKGVREKFLKDISVEVK